MSSSNSNLNKIHYIIILFWGDLDMWFREGDGTPLQYTCLENPMDGGAW